MRSLFSLSLLAAQALASPLSTSHRPLDSVRDQQQLPGTAPLLISSNPEAHIRDKYIVVLKDDVDVTTHAAFVQAAHEEDPLEDGGLTHVYNGKIKGYAGAFTSNTLHKLRNMPEVAYIEHDQTVWASEVDKNAPWGLARISHKNRLTLGNFHQYIFDGHGGEGVDAYVIDTGVNIHHVEFEGRAKWGRTVPKNDVDEDANGHGTHCAGTIASRKYGVAKGANIIAVKVLGSNGSGTMADVLEGVLWAAAQAAEKAAAAKAEVARTGKTSHKGSVANMSLGGGKSRALDDAVNRAVDSGLHFAVAAGNENKDACNTSPAGAEKAITVGASTLADSRAYFSNYGPCVDVFAPGLNILSTWKGGNSTTNTISGTSMASPHVAGLLAYFLSIYPSVTFSPNEDSLIPETFSTFSAAGVRSFYSAVHSTLPVWVASFLPTPVQALLAPIPTPTLTPAQLKAAILDLSISGKLSDIPKDTVNKIIFNNATSLY